jgi:glycolate oxidase FAD binding subunit
MTMTANRAARLAEILGTYRVVSEPEELAAHAIDGLTPQLVVCPASAEQVIEVVRFAIAEKLAVQAFGSRSKCEMGMPPARYDIALDMTAMREVAHYDAGDLTLSVDAGMPLRKLETYLSPHGQFLPLAVPCFEGATAGGAVASGIDSVLRQRYGSVRDFLIGAEFVDGTGQLCRSGGRVVKNVTGYDLHKLLVGSLGTLGVITRLNFRTFPLPVANGASLANFSGCDDAWSFRKAVEKNGLPLADLEVLSPGAIDILQSILQRSDSGATALLQRGNWCVYCSYEGNEAVVTRITAELKRLARSSGAEECELLESSADEQLGGMLREAYEWLRWASPTMVLCGIVLPQLSPGVFSHLAGIAKSVSLRSATLLRATGVLYLAVFADRDDELAIVSLVKVTQSVREFVLARSGHTTLLHAPLPVKVAAAAARTAYPDELLQLQLKRAFDPSNIFAPGRIVGGI